MYKQESAGTHSQQMLYVFTRGILEEGSVQPLLGIERGNRQKTSKINKQEEKSSLREFGSLGKINLFKLRIKRIN